MVSIDTEELSEYIRSIIEAAKQGTKDTDFYVDGTIDIEVAVVNTKKAEGGIKIFIAGAKGGYSDDTTSKIKISLMQQQGVAQLSSKMTSFAAAPAVNYNYVTLYRKKSSKRNPKSKKF